MLLHVTAVHSPDNCPAYHQEKLTEVMSSLERREELARQYNIRLHYMASAAPEHVFYCLLEADSIPTVSRFLMEVLPVPHDFKLSVVQSVDELVSTWKPVAKK